MADNKVESWWDRNHEVRVDYKLLIRTSISMMGITVSMALIATVLGAVLPIRPSILPSLAVSVVSVVYPLLFFAFCTVTAFIGDVIVESTWKWKNRLWLLAFIFFLVGVSLFLLSAFTILGTFLELTH